MINTEAFHIQFIKVQLLQIPILSNCLSRAELNFDRLF